MAQFNQIPANIRAPLAYFEVTSNNSLATQPNNRILVFGQKLPAGTAAANVPVLVSSYEEAITFFSRGSMLANMFDMLFRNNSFTEKWCVPLDDATGTNATGSITVTGPATADGTLYLYLGGVLTPVTVSSGDTATEIGDAIEEAINANLDLPITASNSSGTVTITYRHDGTVGNFYNMQINYAGVPSGEVLPPGVTVAIVQLTSGATDPSLTTAIASIPSEIFQYWLIPYQSSTILDAFEDEMDARWNALSMLDGHVFAAIGGTTSAVQTAGLARNHAHVTLFDAGLSSPSPSYLWASALVGKVAESASADPARPFTGITLAGILPPSVQNQRSLSQRNSLLFSGIAIHYVNSGGNVNLERITTTYQKNSAGVPDQTWLDVTTPLTISFLKQNIRSRITTKFTRKKLADDGNRFRPSANVVTPSIIKGELIAWAAEMRDTYGLIENVELFKQQVEVERDPNDKTRVNAFIPINIVNALYIIAGNISFIL